MQTAALILGCLPLPAFTVQTPGPERALARAVSSSEPIAAEERYLGAVRLAPDRARLGVVTQGAELRLIDAKSGLTTIAGRLDESEAVDFALGERPGELWLGHADGHVTRVQGDARLDRFEVHPGARVGGLEVRAGRLAWSDPQAGVGGVLECASGSVLATFTRLRTPGSERAGPALQPSPDGAWVMACVDPPEDGGWGRAYEIWDSGGEELLASARVYASHATPGFAWVAGGLVHGVRNGRTGAHRIELVNLPAGLSESLDSDVDPIHFIDLSASPCGRFVLEGDFEDRGARLFDLEQRTGAGFVLGSEERVVPLGFLQASDGTVVAATTACRRAGLALWSVVTGECLAASVGAFEDRRLTRVRSLATGSTFLAEWSVVENGAYVSHLEVLRL